MLLLKLKFCNLFPFGINNYTNEYSWNLKATFKPAGIGVGLLEKGQLVWSFFVLEGEHEETFEDGVFVALFHCCF